MPQAFSTHPPVALTIAGSDSGGAAGVAADLKTFAALGVHGTCAITAVTAQNSLGVAASFPLPRDLVAAQIEAVVSDLGCQALKTGLLATTEIVETVYRAVQEHNLRNLVVDPIMMSTSGAILLEPAAKQAYRDMLFPVAHVITPNLPEAEAFLERTIRDADEMAQAARDLCEFGCQAALITGGHLPGESGESLDVLFEARTGRAHFLSRQRLATQNTHGSGCVFSAALTAYLARGETLLGAATRAKEFVTHALDHALDLGAGPGPVNPLFSLHEGAG